MERAAYTKDQNKSAPWMKLCLSEFARHAPKSAEPLGLRAMIPGAAFPPARAQKDPPWHSPRRVDGEDLRLAFPPRSSYYM